MELINAISVTFRPKFLYDFSMLSSSSDIESIILLNIEVSYAKLFVVIRFELSLELKTVILWNV